MLYFIIMSNQIGYTSLNTTIYNPIIPTPGFTGTHGTYILSGLSGPSGSIGPSTFLPITTGYTGNIEYSFGSTGTNIPGPICNDTIIKNIPHVGYKTIPKNSTDIITFEDINDGDILINFNRETNKTEYDCDAYYKESTLNEILKTKKNQFTLKSIDISSIVKYTAKC